MRFHLVRTSAGCPTCQTLSFLSLWPHILVLNLFDVSGMSSELERQFDKGQDEEVMNHHPFEVKCIYCRAHVVVFLFPNPLSSLYVRLGGRAIAAG